MALHDGDEWKRLTSAVRRVPMSASPRRTIFAARTFYEDSEYRWSKIADRLGQDVRIVLHASADVFRAEWLFVAESRVRSPRVDSSSFFMSVTRNGWEVDVWHVILAVKSRVAFYLFAFLCELHGGLDDD